MTDEQAIVYLESLKEYVDKIAYAPDMYEAIDKAIQALEQQPCEDCVSRKAVLDKKQLVELEDGQSFYCINPKDVETLPSVTPHPKLGEWIVTGYDYKCNNCEADINGEINYMSKSKIKYCPYCGAKMESEED